MLEIKSIDKNSLGKKLHICKGDSIIEFDFKPAFDILDYYYYDEQTNFTLTVQKRSGDKIIIPVKKREEESLGLNFVCDGLDIKTCQNKCVFCFVDQMPKNMRPSLYVKDDDYRQSFLSGNFVTLTNLKDSDIERIGREHLSPLYISVQAMNGELRNKMLNNRFADRIEKQISYFCERKIYMHTQVVLVPSLNDGKELDYTARELFKYYPYVKDVAVVPCGITKFREGLFEIKEIDEGYANCVIEQVKALNSEFKCNFIQLADEFYFRAGKPVEPYEFYGEFEQEGNGVGTTAKFLAELNESLEECENHKTYLSVCGESAAEFIKSCAKKVEEKCKGLKVDVLAVKNEFFGDTVNCTGLLTGGDILKAVLNKGGKYDGLLIPDVCLKQFDDVFLDDTSVKELEEKSGLKVIITDGTGYGFFDTLTGKN